MTLPLAHLADHWWMYALYGIPVVIVLFAAARESIRGRRERRMNERP